MLIDVCDTSSDSQRATAVTRLLNPDLCRRTSLARLVNPDVVRCLQQTSNHKFKRSWREILEAPQTEGQTNRLWLFCIYLVGCNLRYAIYSAPTRYRSDNLDVYLTSKDHPSEAGKP